MRLIAWLCFFALLGLIVAVLFDGAVQRGRLRVVQAEIRSLVSAVQRLTARLESAFPSTQPEVLTVTLSMNWRSGGDAKTHTVVKTANETVAEFRARADEEFDAKLAEFPPDAN